MHRFVPAFEFRRRAREAMKPVMSILVVVTLIAMLPNLVSSAISTITGSDPSAAIADLYTQERITAMMGADAQAAAAASDELLNGMLAFFAQKWPLIALTAAITLIFSPVLTLGFNHTLLKTLRREEITYTTVFARLPLFFKAVGLHLMIALRVFLWMLPGWGVSLLGAVVMVFVPALGLLIMLAAMVLMIVLMVRAAYRYRLATYILADLPETGINAAIRRSSEVMKGRKMELFSLEISFVGWHLLISILQMMLLALFGTVIGMALGMFASFLLQMYMHMAIAAFYQEYAVGPLEPAKEEPSAEQEELN